MSSSIPPFPYFNGIEYNSAFFTSPDSGLTITQANSKYLQKTIPDIATAIETFTAGIKTDAINPTTTTGTIQIGQTATNSNVEIASQANRSTVLHLGDGNSSSGAIHIGNGSASSNNINILNGNYTTFQTAGTVNILTGTHAVNSFGGNMNICTGSRGTLTIGSSLLNQILFNKQTQFSSGIYNDKMDAISVSSAMTIGSTINATGSLTLGQSTTPISLGGPTTASQGIITNSISNVAITDSLLLVNTQTTGDILIGNGATRSGGIVIGGKGISATSNTITIGGGSGTSTTINSATFNLQAPITPNYAISGTTGTGTGKIGQYIKPASNYGVFLTAGQAKTLNQFTLSSGIWLCTGNVTTGSSGAGYNALSFSLSTNNLNLTLGAMNIPAFNGFTYNLCCTYTFCLTVSTTIIYLVGQVGSDQTWSDPVLTATRLA